jgi:predicted NUDIX family NTP pyrophosphohydrolase
VPLEPIVRASGRQVMVWAVEGNFDAGAFRGNPFSIAWPPRSGRRSEFPEVDRAGWSTLEAARRRINPGQRPLVEQLSAWR